MYHRITSDRDCMVNLISPVISVKTRDGLILKLFYLYIYVLTSTSRSVKQGFEIMYFENVSLNILCVYECCFFLILYVVFTSVSYLNYELKDQDLSMLLYGYNLYSYVTLITCLKLNFMTRHIK